MKAIWIYITFALLVASLIGFNATYVADILAHLDAEKATFKFSSPTRAGIVVPDAPKENEEVLMLVMPVRLTA